MNNNKKITTENIKNAADNFAKNIIEKEKDNIFDNYDTDGSKNIIKNNNSKKSEEPLIKDEIDDYDDYNYDY